MTAQLFSNNQLAAAKSFYDENGFVVVEDVFSAQQVGLASQVWETILHKRRASGDRKYRSLLLPHRHYPAILELIQSKSLLDCVRTLLEGDVQLIQSQLMFGHPGNGGFTPHQDNFTNRVRPADAAVAAWIAMEDVAADSGALKVWAGSHKQGLYPVEFDYLFLLKRIPDLVRASLKTLSPRFFGAENDSGVMERYSSCTIPQAFEEVILAVRSGAVIFMHGNLVHASLPNSSTTRFRRSLLTNFIRQGSDYWSGILTGRRALRLDDLPGARPA